MQKTLWLFLIFLTTTPAFSQLREDQAHFDREGETPPPRKATDIPELSLLAYSSIENPYYWQNRLPFEGYWQQDVHYQINAVMDSKGHALHAKSHLTYRNNSPDTLRVVYFFLYQNTFKNDGRASQQLDKGQRLVSHGTTIEALIHNGTAARYEITDDLMKVYLNKPLAPGYHATFDIDFVTSFAEGMAEGLASIHFESIKTDKDSIYEAAHYAGVRWYPRIAVYSRQRTWQIEPGAQQAYQGDYGSFDVRIGFPAHYIAEGTGLLVNEAEVLPTNLQEAISLKRFASKPWESVAEEIIPPSSQFKTWVFQALNVRDFAFVAGPTFRRGVAVTDNKIACVAMVRARHAARWQGAANYSMRLLRQYEDAIGNYPYQKLILADMPNDGAYSMLFLAHGTSTDYRTALAKNLSGNWYPSTGVALDKAFGEIFAAEAMARSAPLRDAAYQGAYHQRWKEYYFPYLLQHRLGAGDPISQPYLVTMLFNLRYTLGNQNFKRLLRFYTGKWQLMQPTERDFRQAALECLAVDLGWFFDQWAFGNKHIDYAVKGVKRKKGGKQIRLSLVRKGSMHMPVDLSVITQDGDSLRYTIPNGDYAKRDFGLTVLPTWNSTGDKQLHYSTTIDLPARAKKVVIDPSHQLADINLLNNQSGLRPVKLTLSFLPKKQQVPSWEKYELHLRPHLWWNGYSGLQTGLRMEGSYLGLGNHFSAGIWYSTGRGVTPSPTPYLRSFAEDYHRWSYRANYETPLAFWGPAYRLAILSAFQDGLHRHEVSFRRHLAQKGKTKHHFYTTYKYLYRKEFAWRDYLITPEQWEVDEANASLILGYQNVHVGSTSHGQLTLEARTSFLGSANDYGYLQMELTETHELWRKLKLQWRATARYGLGDTPLESKLYIAGGSPEEAFEQDFYRARGFFPDPLFENRRGREPHNVHQGGGLNLRGYSGYLAQWPDGSDAWFGDTGFGINAELELDGLVHVKPPFLHRYLKLRTYLFYDAGIIGRTRPGLTFEPQFQTLRQDLGAGLALEVRDGYFFSQDKPLVLRVDFPLVLSKPPASQEYVQFRWVVGVGRAF